MAAIHHVTLELESSALEPCIAFYGHLGFEPVEVPPGIAGRAIWLEDRSRGQQVHLMPTQAPLARAGHFAVICPDYEATVRGLADAGHEVEPRREHWGSPRAYLRDPAGNLIELMREPPDAGTAEIHDEGRK